MNGDKGRNLGHLCTFGRKDGLGNNIICLILLD